MKRNILVLVLLVSLVASAFGQFEIELDRNNGNLIINGLREGFESITELEIPDNIGQTPVVAISSGAFSDYKPTSITLPANINIQPDSFFYSLYDSYMKNGRRATTFAVAYSTFNDFEILIFNNISVEITGYTGSVKDVRIPDRINNLPVVAIGQSAFYQKQLTSVTIPNSVASIGGYAFQNNQLTSITLPNSLTSIGDSAFYGNKLTSVTLPNSLTSIGMSAFNSNQLTNVTFPNSLTFIGYGAFYRNKLTSVVIPNSVTEIGKFAFAGSIDGRDVGSGNVIRSVTFGNALTKIGEGAFQYNQLTSVIIPNSVTEIGESAFTYNPLVSVTIPESVRKIESGAFSTRNADAGGTLTTIIIGSNVENVDDGFGFGGYFHQAYRETNRRAGRYVIVRNGGRTNSGRTVDTWERAGNQ